MSYNWLICSIVRFAFMFDIYSSKLVPPIIQREWDCSLMSLLHNPQPIIMQLRLIIQISSECNLLMLLLFLLCLQLQLQRNEVIALMNLLNRLSESVKLVHGTGPSAEKIGLTSEQKAGGCPFHKMWASLKITQLITCSLKKIQVDGTR